MRVSSCRFQTAVDIATCKLSKVVASYDGMFISVIGTLKPAFDNCSEGVLCLLLRSSMNRPKLSAGSRVDAHLPTAVKLLATLLRIIAL